jgi:hypothetical protein
MFLFVWNHRFIGCRFPVGLYSLGKWQWNNTIVFARRAMASNIYRGCE